MDYSKWDRRRPGWPGLALVLLMLIVGWMLIGPVIHIALFFINIVLAALPLLLVVGGIWFVLRPWRRRHGYFRREKAKRGESSHIFYV